MNDLIVRKIKEARLERGLTQKDLANHLGRTSAAISDLERGKVQATASDLFIISRLLNKPIEFFYGEEFGERDTSDLVALMRKQPAEARTSSIITTSMLLKLFELGEEIKQLPENEKVPEEIVKQFFNVFIPFSNQLNQMTLQLNVIRDKLIEEMKLQGINISNTSTD